VNFIPPGNKLHEFERKGYPIFNYEVTFNMWIIIDISL
jgi:hypothetical protein